MKCVILAGGLGTRLSEETSIRPKPMVEIGGLPILWHIMKCYATHGVDEFIICCGYKGYVIKEYFANYFLHVSDVTFRIDSDSPVRIHRRNSESWCVTLVDTGELTQTAGRLLRVREHLGEENFYLTYGDGLSNVDLTLLTETHRNNRSLVTLTAVQPPGRYGALHLNGNIVERFQEKPDGDNAWINGGFFVANPSVLEYIDGDQASWESEVLPFLAKSSRLSAYLHRGFWQPMDTLRDRNRLEELWASGAAPWKCWS